MGGDYSLREVAGKLGAFVCRSGDCVCVVIVG